MVDYRSILVIGVLLILLVGVAGTYYGGGSTAGVDKAGDSNERQSSG